MNYQHPERCVFLGNIPYLATEDQVYPILASIGPVVKIELKSDAMTGKNTGIGFCEFQDKQTADEARKMNNKKSLNGRLLRIDTCDGGKKGVAVAAVQNYSSVFSREEAYRLLINMQNAIKSDPVAIKNVLIENPSIVNALQELLKMNKLE